jgi:two-component system response regulator HydG
VVARALHLESQRQGRYFPLNVAALPDTLLDAELFGHEKGAFTGATVGRRGLFEAADAGTLFLDEIAEMSPGGQAKLLRVVEDGCVRAIGADVGRNVDTRLVSATCAPLAERIAAGAFREDLYHRLSPLVIELPPLRKRTEDIPLLAEHYLKGIAPEVGRKHLTPAALNALKGAAWPGNVRELFGALYRAAVLGDGDTVSPENLRLNDSHCGLRARIAADRARELLDIHGSMSAAARAAGVPRTTFRSVLERDRARGAGK